MRHSGRLFVHIMATSAALAATGTNARAAPFDGFGLYHQGSVDSVENILILPDQSFCIAVIAGSLDLLAAGRWTAMGDGIVLDEVKPPAAPVIVVWKVSQRPEDQGQVVFDFSGQAFGSQGGFVFGTSEGDQLPTDMRPLFSTQANGFERVYTERRPIGIKSFALAYRGQEQADQGPYHILSYRLPDVPSGAGLRIASTYDAQGATPPIHLTGRMSQGVLTLDGRSVGKPAPASPADNATCAAALKKAEGKSTDTLRPGVNRLRPVRTAEVDLHLAKSAKPLFKTSYDEPATGK